MNKRRITMTETTAGNERCGRAQAKNMHWKQLVRDGLLKDHIGPPLRAMLRKVAAHCTARCAAVVGMVAAMAACITATPVAAQAFPTHPVKIVVPYTAGGPADALARQVGQKLSDKWGQPVVIENKPGANTIIGMEYVARSAPDGYTLILATTAMTINAAIVAKLPYDTAKDFTPICNLISTSFLLAVHPSIPAKNLDELIAYAKANPGSFRSAPAATAVPRTFRATCCSRWRGSSWCTFHTRERRWR
jgi:hypothetical protein